MKKVYNAPYTESVVMRMSGMLMESGGGNSAVERGQRGGLDGVTPSFLAPKRGDMPSY